MRAHRAANIPDRNSPLAYSFDEAARISRVGRSTLYNEWKAGRLKARKSGRRSLILAEDLSAWLRALPVAA